VPGSADVSRRSGLAKGEALPRLRRRLRRGERPGESLFEKQSETHSTLGININH
jgi:hypothetical protein